MKKFKEVLLESLKIAGTLLYYVVMLLCFCCLVYDLVLSSRWLEIVCYVMIFANVWWLCDEFSKLGSKISIQTQFIIYGLILFVIGCLSIGLLLKARNNQTGDKSPPDTELIKEAKEEIAFEDSVYQYMLYLNIKHPEVVLKQARIESGNFQSKVFRENNNIFGMKVPKKRANLSSGENLGYAVYNSWQESVIDYALYQSYSVKGMTKEEYIKFLSTNYAEDPSYNQKLK